MLQHEPSNAANDGAPKELDILRSYANLHIQKIGDNEISIGGIENSEQHEFVANIQLRNIDQCDHLDEKIEVIYTLFEEHKFECIKNSEDKQFHLDKTISIQFKSSMADLITYFRNIFTLPIFVTSLKDNIKGIGTNFCMQHNCGNSYQYICV